MEKKKVLILEEKESDTELIRAALSSTGFPYELAFKDYLEEFYSSITDFQPDIIIIDYQSVSYSGAEVLTYCKQVAPDLPLIFIADTLGEELPVKLLRDGATDYLLKTRLDRLHRVIAHALNDYERRKKQMAAEAALERSEKQLRNLMQISPAGVFRSDAEGNCIYVNKRWSEITGIAHEEAMGRGWVKGLHPEDRQRILNRYETAGQTRVLPESEYRFVRPDGKVTWVIGQGKRETGPSEKIMGYITCITDVTALKNTESKLQEKNIRLEKVRNELNQFVYRASHDLRSPLTSAVGLLYLLRMEKNEEQREELSSLMEKSLENMTSYIKEMATHSKNSRLEVKRNLIDFHGTIQSILEELQHLNDDQNIKVQLNIDQNHDFYTDKFRLDVILKNVLANALQYQRRDNNEPRVKLQVTVHKDRTELSVSDNGQGIGEEYADKVFDIFYRANEDSSGSGLGLYLAKEATEKVGGQIRMKSTLGIGSVFDISLPNLMAEDSITSATETSLKK